MQEPKTGLEACGDDCSCPTGGYCQRHKVPKSIHAVKLCRERPGYFGKYERGEGLGQQKVVPADQFTRSTTRRRKLVAFNKKAAQLEDYDADTLKFIREVLCPSCDRYRPATRICQCGKCAKGTPVSLRRYCPDYWW